MKRLIMTSVAAALFGTFAIADETPSDRAIGTRSEPAFVTVDERDRGINGQQTIAATAGLPLLVDADRILSTSEKAIATNGKVTVYVFSRVPGPRDDTFPQR
jgi:hypothetical protein